MKNIKIFDRRVGFSLGALSILMGSIAPAVIPAFASADSQLTSRSVGVSTSAPGATATYQVKFTPAVAGTNLTLQICDSSPLIASSSQCDVPAGFNFNAGDGATYGSYTVDGTNHGANYLDMAAAIGATAQTITITGVTNPTTANHSYYARIVVWTDATTSDTVTGTLAPSAINPGAADVADDGSVALSTGSQIGVQAAVLESLQFCVFGDPNNISNNTTDSGANAPGYLASETTSANGPGAGCNDATTGHTNASPAPTITLGHQVGTGVSALDTSRIDYAGLWTQLSTNASSGAVVYLKSSLSCAGLSRDASTCKIPGSNVKSADTNTLTAGIAGFGFRFGSAVAADAGANSGNIVVNPAYASAKFAQFDSTSAAISDAGKWDDGLVQDTTSTYGGYVLGTPLVSTDAAGAPEANLDVPVAMGVAVANNTPAGLYKANFNLIAVGTF